MWGALAGAGINWLGDWQAAGQEDEDRQAANQLQLQNLAFQNQIFEDQQALQAPYLEFGQGALPGLEAGLTGDFDYTGTPEYDYRQQMGQSALQGILGDRMGESAAGGFTTGLNLDENAQGYGRLIDRVKIGQGAAATAGQSALGYGNALSGAAQSGMAGANLANMNMQNQRFDNLGRNLQDLSGLPAWVVQQNYLSDLNQGEY